jgi:tRNA(Ile)-lysidine synthase
MDLLALFGKHWKENFSTTVSPESLLLIAISGGVDSVVLSHLIKRAGFSFQLAHMNFQLRGNESERDEQFVRTLSQKWNVPLHVKKTDAAAFATQQKISIQEAARELRYEWFKEIQIELQEKSSPLKKQDTWILTAHHADDNIETLLLHLFRGTGLEGLAGIQPIRMKQKLIRPLLPFHKEDLVGYARDNGLDYVEDTSNAEHHYSRNKLRLQLLPVVRELFPDFNQNMAANVERFREGLEIYRRAVKQKIEQISSRRNDEKYVSVNGWKKLHPLPTFTWEIIHPYGFHAAQIPEVIKLLEADSGKYCLSNSHRIIRHRQQLVISPLAPALPSLTSIDRNDRMISFPEGTLQLERVEYDTIPTDASENEIYIPSEAMGYPGILRRWQQGDYFYPLGLNKKKKVSKLLIDLKLSLSEKEKVYVIESNKKIIWVVGIRLDHRFRLQSQKGEALHITYRK